VEEVSWARHGSRFTLAFEEMAAYLAQMTDQTQVSRLLGISWEAVGSIVRRIVAERLEADRFEGLQRIGIDEFSYRKRHHYLTVVVDHDRRRVIWAGEGRSAETLKAFFERLGHERCEQIQLVTIDMAAGYRKAIAECLPRAKVVFDRFHVERLAADAVDEVRRQQVRELGDAGKGIKGLRYVLLKHPDRLKPEEEQKLADLRRWNRPLERAYHLKELLAEILELANRKLAGELLDQWLSWAARSKLWAFVKLGRTIRKHRDGVLAYIETLATNGLVEGFNNKLRVIARRAYGFHSPEPLVAMLFLCAGGIQINPPLPTRT
jgi:transposase